MQKLEQYDLIDGLYFAGGVVIIFLIVMKIQNSISMLLSTDLTTFHTFHSMKVQML